MNLIEQDFWNEYVTVNNWYYGTSNNQVYSNEDSVLIMTPHGLSLINNRIRKDTLVIYLDIDENTRTERLIYRNQKTDIIERRLIADYNDFKDFTDFDIRITNGDF